jgi:low affinity Fe/Cu permease
VTLFNTQGAVESPVLIGEHARRPFWHVLSERFRAFAHKVAMATGSPWAFTLGVATVVLWALTGRWFGYSESWQLVINTGTTIVTFLMVFILQNTQARDSRELHVKLDELLRAIESARSDIIRCSELSDEQLDKLHDTLRATAVKPEDQPGEPGKIVLERELRAAAE